MEHGEIANWRMGILECWHQLPTAPDDSAWAEEVAEVLADPPVRERLVKELRTVHPALIGKPNSHLMIGAWVPDPATGEIGALMYLDTLLPSPELHPVTRDGYRALLEPDRRKGITVYGRIFTELDLPAGPTLLVQEVTSPGRGLLRRKPVREYATYTVFPPGSCEAIELVVVTDHLHLSDRMAEDSALTVESLEVDIVPPGDGSPSHPAELW